MIAEKIQVKVKGMIHIKGVNDAEFEKFMRTQLGYNPHNYATHIKLESKKQNEKSRKHSSKL